MKTNDNRIGEIDGLRGLAVTFVLIWHFTGSMAAGSGPVQSAVRMMTVFGRTGVDLFFVLSGFLIIGILMDRRGADNLFPVFYLRRFMRIWPPYLCLMAVYWLCYAVLGESEAFNARHGFLVQFIAQITFNYNTLMALADGGISRGFSVVWSVNIEEWFYIVFPILLVSVPERHLPRVLVGIGLASALARAGVHVIRPDLWQAPYVLMPLRLDGLCAGGLVAAAVRNDQAIAWVRSNCSYCAKLVLALLAMSIVGVILSFQQGKLDGQMYLWGHLLLAVTYAAILAFILIAKPRLEFLKSRVLGLFGRYSYTMYLIHPLFISLFFVIGGRREVISDWVSFGLAASAFVCSAVYSIASYHLMEGWLVGLGHQYKYRSAKAPAPAE
jgi:peptidoglycan/LPS O-acetylase OafA/YrhL